MLIPVLEAASILLLALSAGLAFRLIRMTGRHAAWILIASAFSLAAAQRAVTLVRFAERDFAHPPGSLSGEWIVLVISALMALGIAKIALLFRKIRRSESALALSEKRYRNIFHKTAVSLWEEDVSKVKSLLEELKSRGVSNFRDYMEKHPDFVRKAVKMTKVLDVNERTLELYKAKSKEELLGSLDRVFIPESYPVFREILIALAEGKTYFEAEAVNRTLQGEPMDILMTVTLFSEGAKTDHILVSIMDITERKRIERNLYLFKNLMDQTNDAIYVVDPEDGRFLDVNYQACASLGYSREELLKMGVPDIDMVLTSRELWRARVEKLKRGRSNLIERTHQRKDGSTFPVEVNVRYVCDGEEAYLIAVVRDISERRKIETELQRMEKLESLGVLAGGIAHDFNNLLTGILGNIGIAKKPGISGKLVYERLEKAEKAALRAKGLTRQLLTFSRGGTPVKSTLSLKKLIRDAAGFALTGSNVKCEFDLAEDLRFVDADEDQIVQVIHNLVLNADQAMPEGGEIRIRAANVAVNSGSHLPLQKGEYVKVCVEDQGFGIPKENLNRIFDPYFTTKKRGSGLGLASAYSILKRHGGWIDVEPRAEGGTTFAFYLPVSEKALRFKKETSERPLSGQGRILVMDDEEIVRDVAGKILRHMGYEVDFAGEGSEALDLYRDAKKAGRPFHLVIMDLTIPGGMGGKETIRKLLEIDPEAKAVVSSGYSNDPIMSDCKAYGFKGVLRKPYRPREMGDVLSSLGT